MKIPFLDTINMTLPELKFYRLVSAIYHKEITVIDDKDKATLDKLAQLPNMSEEEFIKMLTEGELND